MPNFPYKSTTYGFFINKVGCLRALSEQKAFMNLNSAVEIEKVTQVVVQLCVFLRLQLTQLVLLRSDRKTSVSRMNTGFEPFS
jgi:hypothetical protein